MPVTINLRFLAGHYHATPWGRHVNEGVHEWPPSPWRFLRALVSVWRRTRPDIPERQVHDLLGQLSSPPCFRLPQMEVAHSRHYMPWEKKGPQDKALIFDTFVAVDRNSSIDMHWPNAELDESSLLVLRDLLNNLTFLGRCESWTEATVVDDGSSDSETWNCVPAGADEFDPQFVLCPDPASCFGSEHYPKIDAKKLAKGKVKPSEYLFDCPPWHLCLDTETINANRWSAVPGAKWVRYTRPESRSLQVRESSGLGKRLRPTTLRFLLDGPVLPLVTDTVAIAEAFRRAAMSAFNQWCRQNATQAAGYLRPGTELYSSPTLSGKNSDGTRLSGPGHAHYWPIPSLHDRRRIGSVIVYARHGFSPEEEQALARLRTLRISDETELHCRLVSAGHREVLGSALIGPSDVWQSVTPFLGNADIGVRGQSRFLRKGLRREWRRLAEQGEPPLTPPWEGGEHAESPLTLPWEGGGQLTEDVEQYKGVELIDIVELSAEEIQRMAITPSGSPLGRGRTGMPQPREFLRARYKDGGRQAYRPAAMYRLRFSKAIEGPFSLGYACHFGMGLFIPVRS